MSSRRKRAPPVRVDDEAKKKLNWNMLEDRQRECEVLQTDDPMPSCSATPAPLCSLLTPGGSAPERGEGEEELPVTSSDAAVALWLASLSLSVLPTSMLAPVWKSLIGEFSLTPATVPDPEREHAAFTLRRTGQRLILCYSSQEESSGEQGKAPEEEQKEEVVCTQEHRLGSVQLEDLEWLQKRGVVQLSHQTKGEAIKVHSPQNTNRCTGFTVSRILTLDT